MAKKNENLIMKLVLENNELRDKILTTEEEMKNFLEIRNELNDGSSIIVMDREHVMKIEERNKLLSKENEILVVNYNKIQNELLQLKNLVVNYNKIQNELLQLKNQNQIMGNDDINIKYQKLNSEFNKVKNDKDELLNSEFNKVKNDKDELFEQNNIIYEKMNDISNMNNNLERENFKLKDIINKMNNEIEIYKEANKKYENMINNENK